MIELNTTGATQTAAVDGGRMVRIAGWYDNEWGFSSRMSDTAALWGTIPSTRLPSSAAMRKNSISSPTSRTDAAIMDRWCGSSAGRAYGSAKRLRSESEG